MSTQSTLRRLQSLRGLTRIGSTHTVLAQVQGDLQTVIEAVLDLAGHDGEHEPVTDEPAVGEQVTDCAGDVWQRFDDGWHWWSRAAGVWSPGSRAWVSVQVDYAPLRPTTDVDRRRVGLPARDENTPPASQNRPEDARSADSGTGGPPEPESDAQGRLGWLHLRPGDERRHLMQEVPGGWTRIDTTDDPYWHWLAEDYPDAEFTPIRTLADDEVAVKREDLRAVLSGLAAERERDWALIDRLVAALKEGR